MVKMIEVAITKECECDEDPDQDHFVLEREIVSVSAGEGKLQVLCYECDVIIGVWEWT